MARNVIALLGGPPVETEETAVNAITPGHLLIRAAAGVSRNTAANAAVAPLFALERDEMGQDIDAAYAVGDAVKVGAFHKGQRVYAFIPSGQNITNGDYLSSDATGCLQAAGANPRLAQAVESVNNAAGPGNHRIRVEII